MYPVTLNSWVNPFTWLYLWIANMNRLETLNCIFPFYYHARIPCLLLFLLPYFFFTKVDCIPSSRFPQLIFGFWGISWHTNLTWNVSHNIFDNTAFILTYSTLFCKFIWVPLCISAWSFTIPFYSHSPMLSEKYLLIQTSACCVAFQQRHAFWVSSIPNPYLLESIPLLDWWECQERLKII